MLHIKLNENQYIFLINIVGKKIIYLSQMLDHSYLSTTNVHLRIVMNGPLCDKISKTGGVK